MDGGHSEALKQKIRPPAEASADQGGPRRAFRLAMARAGEAFSGIQLNVTKYEEEPLELDEVLERVDGAPTIYVLNGPKETLGIATLDHGFQGALLEHLTTGRVKSGDPNERRPTRTDTTLTGDFLNLALQMISEETGAFTGFPDFSAFAFSHTLPDKRAAELAIEPMPFRLFSATLDIEEGKRSGLVSFFIPLVRAGRGVGLSVGGWDKVWGEQVRRVEVHVEGILCRVKRTLNDVIAMEPGQIVEIPKGRLENVSLIGRDGKIIARAKLGRLGSHRALRIGNHDCDVDDAGFDNRMRTFQAPSMPAPPTASVQMETPQLPGTDPAIPVVGQGVPPLPMADPTGPGGAPMGTTPMPLAMPLPGQDD